MSEHIWETFDGLFKTLYRQGEQVEQLERRVVDLETKLQERAAANASRIEQSTRLDEMTRDFPVERAA